MSIKPEFRPIQITLIDFLGVLLPGVVWLLVVSALIEFIEIKFTTPIGAWQQLLHIPTGGTSWFTIIIIIFLALIIGYSLKPISMGIAGLLSKIILFKMSPRIYSFLSCDATFPYNNSFLEEKYYKNINIIMNHLLKLNSPEELPGCKPFSEAKRYLRLISPTLWEESEQIEAEVRMIGGLFLAFFCSTFLSIAVMIKIYFWGPNYYLETSLWIFISLLATLVLGNSFNVVRRREVEYTYMNLILAEGHRKEEIATQKNANNPQES